MDMTYDLQDIWELDNDDFRNVLYREAYDFLLSTKEKAQITPHQIFADGNDYRVNIYIKADGKFLRFRWPDSSWSNYKKMRKQITRVYGSFTDNLRKKKYDILKSFERMDTAIYNIIKEFYSNSSRTYTRKNGGIGYISCSVEEVQDTAVIIYFSDFPVNGYFLSIFNFSCKLHILTASLDGVFVKK